MTQWSTLASGDSDPAFDLVAVFVEDADKFEPKSLGPLQIPVVVFGETSVSFPEYEGSALESMVPHGRYSPTTLDNFRHLFCVPHHTDAVRARASWVLCCLRVCALHSPGARAGGVATARRRGVPLRPNVLKDVGRRTETHAPCADGARWTPCLRHRRHGVCLDCRAGVPRLYWRRIHRSTSPCRGHRYVPTSYIPIPIDRPPVPSRYVHGTCDPGLALRRPGGGAAICFARPGRVSSVAGCQHQCVL